MISSIVGRHLLKKKLLTTEQLEKVLSQQQQVHVKLGLIAVSEGLMTQEAAEQVHRLQAVTDKRFGDIAVEKGYLTEDDVEALLQKQQSAYLAFAQVLENLHLMTMAELEQHLIDFQTDYNLTLSDMEDLKSDDIDRILPLLMPVGCDKYLNVAVSVLHMILRCIDTEIYMEKAFVTKSCKEDNGAVQVVEGEPGFCCGIAGKGQSLLAVVSAFDGEKYTEVNEDSMDAAGEFLNCLDGFYARNLSQGGAFTELRPPKYSSKVSVFSSDEMLVLPVYILGQRMDLLIAAGCEIKMEE